MQPLNLKIEAAASAIRNSSALLFTAGAGMGVDSGLPDFRGDEGFWKAYPPLRKLKISFSEMANPAWFRKDPQLAWGFYGHRAKLYRDSAPHAGFAILKAWTEGKPSFVFTSNVDGHFQKAGFDHVEECHGSILHAQCSVPCSRDVWELNAAPEVDETTFRATGDLPRCPRCGELARPNILMFNDAQWIEKRSEEQHARFGQWLQSVAPKPLAIIECGAGLAIPTVRHVGEDIAHAWGKGGGVATLIRINVRESQGPHGTISIPLGAREALEALAAQLQ